MKRRLMGLLLASAALDTEVHGTGGWRDPMLSSRLETALSPGTRGGVQIRWLCGVSARGPEERAHPR